MSAVAAKSIRPPYVPQPGSFADRVCRYLQTHPREELDTPDMVAKFNVSKGAIDAGLEVPIAHGLLVRNVDDFGKRFWKAGPRLASLGDAIPTLRTIGSTPAAAPAPASVFQAGAQAGAAARQARKRGASAPLPRIDITTLVVRTGVPIPTHSRDSKKDGGKYDALFAQINEVGASIVVDLAYLGALKSAAKKYAKTAGGAQYTVRKTEDGQTGVWRIK